MQGKIVVIDRRSFVVYSNNEKDLEKLLIMGKKLRNRNYGYKNL